MKTWDKDGQEVTHLARKSRKNPLKMVYTELGEMMNEHTPGPWIAVNISDGSKNSPQFGIVSAKQPNTGTMTDIATVWNRGGKKKAAANAHLIAAAPELASWLAWALERVEHNAHTTWQFEQANAVLAKASNRRE